MGRELVRIEVRTEVRTHNASGNGRVGVLETQSQISGSGEQSPNRESRVWDLVSKMCISIADELFCYSAGL